MRENFVLIGVAVWFATLIGLLIWAIVMLARQRKHDTVLSQNSGRGRNDR